MEAMVEGIRRITKALSIQKGDAVLALRARGLANFKEAVKPAVEAWEVKASQLRVMKELINQDIVMAAKAKCLANHAEAAQSAKEVGKVEEMVESVHKMIKKPSTQAGTLSASQAISTMFTKPVLKVPIQGRVMLLSAAANAMKGEDVVFPSRPTAKEAKDAEKALEAKNRMQKSWHGRGGQMPTQTRGSEKMVKRAR